MGGGGEEGDKEECCSTQLIDGDGIFNAEGLENLMKNSECGLSYGVVAIMGPKISGKSTLLNHVFRANFKEMDAFKGRSQMTKGIWMAKYVRTDPCMIVLDMEGTDGRESGEDDTEFGKQRALFALAMSDTVLINMWCHDIGRFQAANVTLLETVFQVIMRVSSHRKMTLLFIIQDIQKIWDGVPKPEAHKDTPLNEFFNLEVVALSSYEEKEEQFKEQVDRLRNRFIRPGRLAWPSAQKIWKYIRENKDLDLPAREVTFVTVRCEEIANEKLSHFTSDEGWLVLDEAVQSGFVSGFGEKVSSILDAYLSEYDSEAIYFDESVRNLKRKNLESKALHLVHPAYQTLLGHLQAKCRDNFNKALEQSLKKGEGFAASVRIYVVSSMLEFDQGVADASVKHADWDASKLRVKLRRDIEEQAVSVCSAKFEELISNYENQFTKALSEPVECLFESAGSDTWALIRKLVRREKETALSKLTTALNGFELDQETFDQMVQNQRDFANTLVEKKAREKARNVLIHMKDRLPSAALNVLSVMSAIRLDEKPNRIGNQLLSSIVAPVNALCASFWDEIPAEDTLLTPVQCMSLWRKFKSETKSIIVPAISVQEARRRSRYKSHLWAILVMISLGFNEIMLLLKNPSYLFLLLVVYLVGKPLWLQSDIRKLCNRQVSELVSGLQRFSGGEQVP
ncbi:hypothetical protein MKW98_021616 [Papaver atlanticum]|uniref:GB1/RHD3-type G domain-containing protein n=1 Tax=Papaver atlanticum TaxID=357466 RepID=A0AAD4TC34_9MAGN|nr:hypothetical protein MKW98_021616 [Papaver atlanticum]